MFASCNRGFKKQRGQLWKIRAQSLLQLRMRIFSLFLLAVLMIAGTDVARGQASSSMSGRIEDPSAAGVPGATVTVTNLETGIVRPATSDESGAYRVLDLPVGRYEVKAEKAGFKAAVQTGINLSVAQEAVINLRLDVGAATEQVTVTSEAPVVNTTTSSVTGLVGEQEVKDLPLNGRSFDQLILLNAGVLNYSNMRNAASTANGARNMFSVAGRRGYENYFTINGVELAAMNADISTPFGVSSELLGIDAIREFNVLTDTYGAEYGKRPGGQVTIVTSSGTNQLHGTIFEFLRNSDFDARNFFDHRIGAPPFERNQFGGALGGPIKKDKTFIFGNYEGFRQRLGESIAIQVPDAQARLGNLLNTNGVYAPVAGLQPAMLPFVQGYWPAPNGPELGGGIASYFANPVQTIREDYGTVRVDHRFSDKDSLNGSYTIDDGFLTSPEPDPVINDVLGQRAQTGSIQETHIFTANLINVLTLGVARTAYSANPSPDSGFSSSLDFVAGAGPGNITVGGGSGGGGASGSITGAGPASANIAVDWKTIPSLQESVQFVRGKNTFSFGGLIQKEYDAQNGPSKQLGQAAFANLTAMLQGTVGTFQVIPDPTERTWRQWLGAWYVQDTIQLTPRLNVRIGLRHEFDNGWNDPTGRAANYAYTNGIMNTNPFIGTSPLTQNNAKKLFGPRLGIAWDPFGTGKTSIRAAAGTYYFLQDNLSSVTKQVQPFNSLVALSNVNLLSILPVNPLLPVLPSCENGPSTTVPANCNTFGDAGVEPNFKTPTVQEWNLTIEQQLTSNMSLRVSYVGSEEYHSFIALDPDTIQPVICNNAAGCVAGGLNGYTVTAGVPKLNPAGESLVAQGTLYVPIQPFRPNPNLNSGALYWRAEGNANYNALQVEVKRRFSQGLYFRGNYTWSKSLDDGSGSGQGNSGLNDIADVLNPYNIQSSYGPDGHDIRHQGTISGGYELPFGKGKAWLNNGNGVDKVVGGWTLDSIFTVTSGPPLTPILSSSVSGQGDTGNPDRPSWNPSFTGPVILGLPTEWFNPKAFISPPSGTYGNVSRGALRGPGLTNLDLSLHKNTNFTERIKLQFRAEIFNILNHPNFGEVNNSTFSSGQLTATPTYNPTAGSISSTVTTSRQIQLGLKLIF